MGRHRALIEDVVHELAAIHRPSASDGEREAAERIVARLTALGCRDARVEAVPAHGGYWWPLGIASGAGFLATFLPAPARVALGALAAAAVWDDVSGGRQWFRRPLRRRTAHNAVAEAGDPAASRTAVVMAHHDAAHSGLVFSPRIPAAVAERFPELIERSDRTFPVMSLVFAGPALAAVGLKRVARFLTAGTALAMADIGRSQTVVGANDNLSAVAVLAAVAEALRREPVEGVRVVLVSTGSEESLLEGIRGFVERHRDGLLAGDAHVLVLECVGSPSLTLIEGEGMLRMCDYPAAARDEVARAAQDAGVELARGLRTIAATDGLITMGAGVPTALLGGVDDRTGFPANYHWPTDVPENLTWERIEDAAAVTEAWIRRLGR